MNSCTDYINATASRDWYIESAVADPGGTVMYVADSRLPGIYRVRLNAATGVSTSVVVEHDASDVLGTPAKLSLLSGVSYPFPVPPVGGARTGFLAWVEHVEGGETELVITDASLGFQNNVLDHYYVSCGGDNLLPFPSDSHRLPSQRRIPSSREIVDLRLFVQDSVSMVGLLHRDNVTVSGSEHGFTVSIANLRTTGLALSIEALDIVSAWRQRFVLHVSHASPLAE